MIECINDTFTGEQLAIFAKYNIEVPRKSVIYTIRKELTTRNGRAYLLNEIVNKPIPNGTPDFEGNDFLFEVNWHISRFNIIIPELEEIEEEQLEFEEV